MLVHPGATIQTGLQEAPGSAGAVGLTTVNLAYALFRGVGEVFLQDNPWSGVVFVIAILVNSRVSFAFALLGSALGGLTALVLGGDAGPASWPGHTEPRTRDTSTSQISERRQPTANFQCARDRTRRYFGFGTYTKHHPFGLIWPSTTLHELGGAHCRHPSHC